MDASKLINVLYLYAGDLAVAVLTITIGICLFRSKEMNIPLRRLLYFLIWNLLIEIAARLFIVKGINNLPLLHVYTVGEFMLISWFYHSLILKSNWFQHRFWWFILSISLAMVGNSIFLGIGGDYNVVSKTFVQIVIISYAIIYFYNLTDDQSNNQKYSKSLRLINSAILTYYSGSLFIFMCSQALRSYPEWIKTFWAFNAVLNLIFQSLILFSIWIVMFRKMPSSS